MEDSRARLVNFADDRILVRNTPLQIAAIGSFARIAEVLLEAGADRNAQNSQGLTALMIAVRKQDVLIMNILLEADADCNLQDSEGGTALMIAVGQQNLHDREHLAGSWCGLQCPE